MIGQDSARLQVVLSKKEAKLLEDRAEKEGRSVSNLLALIIRRELKQIKK